LLILLADGCHDLNIESVRKEVHVLPKVCKSRVDLNLVLPFVVSPFLLEVKLAALSWLKFIDEIDLDLIQVDYVRNVAASRIKGQVAVNGTIVC
jgi:hypothetical protein